MIDVDTPPMSNLSRDKMSELIKKLIFVPLSFLIIKENYDYSLSVGVLLDCYKSFTYIISIVIPTAIIIVVYLLKSKNYKYCMYVFFISLAIFLVDALFIEHVDMTKLQKFIENYPLYIGLTYLASISADLASADFRIKIGVVEDKILKIFDPIANNISQLIRSILSLRK